MPELKRLFLQMLVILLAARLTAAAFRAVRQPGVVGEMAAGMSWRDSLAVGVLVNTRGLVELVILNVGLDLHILSPTLFSMMVMMAFATTLMTAPLIDRLRPAQNRDRQGADS